MSSPYDIALAKWARDRNIPRPTTPEAMQVLEARFAADMQNQNEAKQQVIGTAQRTIDPTTAHDPRTILTDNGATVDLVDRVSPDELDDFHELVERRNKALHEAKGDDLTRDVLLQGHDHAALTSTAPFMRTNPVSASKAVLGNSISLQTPLIGAALGDLLRSASQVAQWIADTNSEVSSVTVTFSPISPISNKITKSASEIRPFGIVQFGVGGNIQLLEVDIGRGCQFTVSGSQVSIAVGLDAPSTINPNSVTLSGMISFSVIEKNFPITRTRYIDNLFAVTTSATVTFPPFAKSLTIFNNASALQTGTTTVNFFNSTATSVGQIVIPGNTYAQTIKLDAQAYALNVTNNDASNTNSYACVFELGI